MSNIEKIRISEYSPTNTDIFWYEPSTRYLRVYQNGKWLPIKGESSQYSIEAISDDYIKSEVVKYFGEV